MQIQSIGVALPLAGQGQSSTASSQSGDAAAQALAASASVASPVANTQSSQQNSDQHDSQIQDAVKKVNDTIKTMNQDVSLQFSVDPDTKLRIVKVMDNGSNQVLRQIPSDEVLQIAKAIDKLQGLLVRDKA